MLGGVLLMLLFLFMMEFFFNVFFWLIIKLKKEDKWFVKKITWIHGERLVLTDKFGLDFATQWLHSFPNKHFWAGNWNFSQCNDCVQNANYDGNEIEWTNEKKNKIHEICTIGRVRMVEKWCALVLYLLFTICFETASLQFINGDTICAFPFMFLLFECTLTFIKLTYLHFQCLKSHG